MLIEFSVSNFRSIRERQTLSMVAAPKLRKRENVFNPNVPGERLPSLLKVAAIYGPNASGKSNLLRAMDVVSQIALKTPGVSSPIKVDPFRFDSSLAGKPSTFEFHFIYLKQRYQFELGVLPDRIVHERLTAYPGGKETLLYNREYVEGMGDKYIFGNALEGGADVHQAWRRLTGPQTLFIAQAAANSSEELIQLSTPFAWLKTGVVVVDDGMTRLAQSSQVVVHNRPSLSGDLASFLREVDVPITALRVESKSPQMTSNPNLPADAISELHEGLNRLAFGKSKTIFTHETALGTAEFDFSEESKGTQGLIGFWMPWSVIDHKNGPFSVLAVDELDSSLHPEIVANLVRKFLQFEHCAQLIFTTHDTHLMDTKLLRRDQFWITERDINGATQLRSIHDFEGRESEDVEKRYYEGRYRGLPLVRKN